MYADDNIICCLLPSRCNMFPQKPEVICSDTVKYIIMIIVLISSIFVVWRLLLIVIQFVEKKKSKLIDKIDSEDNCLEEQPLQKDVETKCTDELSNENNSDGYVDKPCSDFNLVVSNSLKRRFDKKDGSSYDYYESHLESSGERLLEKIYMTNLVEVDSVRRDYNNGSTNDEREERNHNTEHLEQHDIKIAVIHGSTVTLVPKEQLQFLYESQEDTNNNKPRNTLPVSDTDSVNQQQRQNKHSDQPT